MKLIVLAATLMLPGAVPAEAPQPAAPAFDQRTLPNVHREGAGCLPIVQQVAGEKRDPQGTRLDQQPPAQLLLAVDREVGGCREATIIRRDIGKQPEGRR